MRRLVLCGTASVLLFASCSKQAALTPQEIFQRAVSKTQHAQSFRFRGEATMSSAGGSMRLSVGSGSMTSGGTVWQCSAALDATRAPDAGARSLHVVADVFAATPMEVDVRLRKVETRPAAGPIQHDVESYRNGWWRVGQGSGRGSGSLTIVPGSQALPWQWQAVAFRNVSDDDGANRLRHFAVTLNRAKLQESMRLLSEEHGRSYDAGTTDLQGLDAQGDVWIDADTLFIRRISWVLRDDTGVRTTLDFSFEDFDAVPDQSLPADVLTLPPPFVSELQGVIAPFIPEHTAAPSPAPSSASSSLPS